MNVGYSQTDIRTQRRTPIKTTGEEHAQTPRLLDEESGSSTATLSGEPAPSQPFIPPSPLGSARREATPTSIPASPIQLRLGLSPEHEPNLPDLGDLLRGTQPPPPSQQGTPHRNAQSKRESTAAPDGITPMKLRVQLPISIPGSAKPLPRPAFQSLSQPTPGPSRTKRKSDVQEEFVVEDATSNEVRRPAKRPKQQPAALRHPDFWHLDGSVIIQVERTLFKLHRSRLAKHSKYFAQLFAGQKGKGKAAQVVDVDEIVEQHHDDGDGMRDADVMLSGDIPTYIVRDTTADDFARLLNLFDDPITLMDGPPRFPVLASILRASTALSFDNLRKWALRHFEGMWPRELAAVGEDSIPYAAATLALARACDVPGVRKRAYYELLRTPGFGQRVEGDDAGDDDDDVQLVGEDGNVVGAEQVPLSHADFVRLLRAREALNLAWIHAAASAPTEPKCPLLADDGERVTVKTEGKGKEKEKRAPSESSTSTQAAKRPNASSAACVAADSATVDARWTTSVVRAGMFEDYMVDPVLGLDQLIGVDIKKLGYCKDCAQARKKAWRKEKEKLWDDLDVWLKLK
ncbi:hypothetical protein FA95DRAFT_1556238 [Auriscalpium vulgare]|uniref:Uncharacterized protein n=1 Tax=Auriscalpium vulgare TaxID=40419 RepID=A0ACB8S1B8_9AGAM|nr:hypothetical protein FA95DRAFT_1556238 [Auriscalpium vulgare]